MRGNIIEVKETLQSIDNTLKRIEKILLTSNCSSATIDVDKIKNAAIRQVQEALKEQNT